jgi:hypothetical protein
MIYNDVCDYYSLGNKFDRLEKYFEDLEADDILDTKEFYYDTCVKLADSKDKIIMLVFYDKYLSKYLSDFKFGKINPNKRKIIKLI